MSESCSEASAVPVLTVHVGEGVYELKRQGVRLPTSNGEGIWDQEGSGAVSLDRTEKEYGIKKVVGTIKVD